MKKLLSVFCIIVTLLCSFTMAVYADVGDNEFDENESNDSFDTANRIYSDYTVYGYLAGQYDMDFFKFTLTAESNVTFLCSSSVSGVKVGLYDSFENIITAGSSSYSKGYYYDKIYKTLYPGTYYILILQDSGYTNSSYLYYFEYEGQSHTHNYSKKVIKPTCDARGYTTYTCTCGDSYKSDYTSALDHEIVTVAGVEPTCLQSGLTNGTYCQVCYVVFEAQETIPAIDHIWGEWEIITYPVLGEQGLQRRYCSVCGTFDDAVIDFSTEHNYVSTIVKATTTADGYINYVCQTCGDTYNEVISKISSIELSSSIVTYNGKVRTPSVIVVNEEGEKLTKDMDYIVEYEEGRKYPGTYIISVSFIGNYKGEKDLTFTIAPKATTSVKAKTQTTSSVTLTWSKTTGATGYEIYKYNSNTKKYIKIKTTTSTSYKVTSLDAGSTYKFKVRPYTKAEDGTTIFGAYSSEFSTATKTVKPTLKTATQSSGKVKLIWDNVSGESGYEIYYSTSKNGTYKKMSGVVANKTTYTSSKLTAGKTYYFKVRTYKTVGDVKVYSSFSSIKSIKIK